MYRRRWQHEAAVRARLQLAARPTDQLTLSSEIAVALGKALHTIEDNCAHQGMDNPQHAWFSYKDSCGGTTTSPDAQPAAKACAEREAAAVFAALAQTLDDVGLAPTALRTVSTRTHWPPRASICAVLGEAKLWDGHDRRWNNDIVVPAFRAQLVAALSDPNAQQHAICAGGETLARASYNPVVDVSGSPTSCMKISLYCAFTGKADEGDEPPPWEQDDHAEAGGCNAGRSVGVWWVAFAMIALICRSRRRAQSHRR
jgi:hypothetical protein